MNSEKKIALLIDADNISSKYIKYILDELSNYGTLSIKRIYGDWTTPNKQGWKQSLLEHSILPIQQYNYTTGKNSTDSTLIIDGMDILYSKSIDIFCIASSDSDFTRLAARFRESGKVVIGIGEQKTPKPFIKACNEFKYLETISNEDTQNTEQNDGNNNNETEVIKQTILDIISEPGSSGIINLSQLGTRLINRYSDFDPRNYGYTNLLKLVSTFPEFDIDINGSTYNVKLKNSNTLPQKIKDEIIRIVKSSNKQTINMGELNVKLKDNIPNFNLKSAGYSKFIKLLNEIDELEIKGYNVKSKSKPKVKSKVRVTK